MPSDRRQTPDGVPASTALAVASQQLRIDVSAALQTMYDDASGTHRPASRDGMDATEPRPQGRRDVQ